MLPKHAGGYQKIRKSVSITGEIWIPVIFRFLNTLKCLSLTVARSNDTCWSSPTRSTAMFLSCPLTPPPLHLLCLEDIGSFCQSVFLAAFCRASSSRSLLILVTSKDALSRSSVLSLGISLATVKSRKSGSSCVQFLSHVGVQVRLTIQ